MRYVKCFTTMGKARSAIRNLREECAEDNSIKKISHSLMETHLANGDIHQFVVIPVNVELEKIVGMMGIIDVSDVLDEIIHLHGVIKHHADMGNIREHQQRHVG